MDLCSGRATAPMTPTSSTARTPPPAQWGSPATPRAAATFVDQLVRSYLLDPTAANNFLAQCRDRLGDFPDASTVGEALGRVWAFDRVSTRPGPGRQRARPDPRPLPCPRPSRRRRHGRGRCSANISCCIGESQSKWCPWTTNSRRTCWTGFMPRCVSLRNCGIRTSSWRTNAGRIPAAAPDRPALHYLVMELIPGGDLEKQVCRNGPATTARACEWIRQAASGLQEAHDHHLIHRDLKPSNLLLTANDQVKVVDFGLARQVSSHKTDPRALLGSLEFMAPEQSTDPSASAPRRHLRPRRARCSGC